MPRDLYMVVGAGKTGYSIARYLKSRALPFILYDTRANPPGINEFYQEFPGVDVFLEQFPEATLASLQAMIVSPGVAPDEKFVQQARLQEVPVYGDIECLAREVTVPIISITGTNGKSTVTTLTGEMARAAGLRVAVAGNIGLPVLDMLAIGASYDVWVLELSSFQLEMTTSLVSRAAVILNVTPDHLDRHQTMDQYAAAKQRIWQHAEYCIYNREDERTQPESGNLVSFGADAPQANNWGLITDNGKLMLARGDMALMPVDDLKIKGRHNWMNALAACALAETIGVQYDVMREVLQRFAGLAHRSQWVRTLDGVDWINDSKGTNIGAAMASITGIGEAITGKIILIAGGEGKGADFADLQDTVRNFVRTTILIGRDAGKIEAALNGVTDIIHAPSLERAVASAQSVANAGDVVLLSPACASFDMFRDFNHRGDEFVAAVKAL